MFRLLSLHEIVSVVAYILRDVSSGNSLRPLDPTYRDIEYKSQVP